MPRRIQRRLEAPVVPKRAAKALHNGIGLGRRGMQWECGATVRTFCAKQTAYAPTRSALDPRCAPEFDPVIRTYTASRRGWLPPGASSGGLTRSPFPRVPAASFQYGRVAFEPHAPKEIHRLCRIWSGREAFKTPAVRYATLCRHHMSTLQSCVCGDTCGKPAHKQGNRVFEAPPWLLRVRWFRGDGAPEEAEPAARSWKS